MSKSSSDATKKPLKQPNDDLLKVMEQLSVTSNETSTQPKNLSDMPFDVVRLIIERSNYKEQLILQKVSKSLRALVDKQKPACKSVNVVFRDESVLITFNNQLVLYADGEYEFKDDGVDKTVIRVDSKKAAFDDLTSTLKNPKLQLEEFSVRLGCSKKKDNKKCRNEIRSVLESLNHQVSVKEFKIDRLSPTGSLSVLQYLKPGFLEKISTSPGTRLVKWRSDPTGMHKVALLEQWKQAKELEIFNFFEEFPLRYARHFKRFQTCERRIYGDKYIRIIDYFSKLDNFEHCTLTCMRFARNYVSLNDLLGAPVSSNTTEEVYHYPIPDSENYLEIKKATKTVRLDIKKKEREIHL